MPFAFEDVVWDAQVLDGDGGRGGAEVVMFAMKREHVRVAIRPMVAAGIEADLVQMAPIALYNTLAFDGPGSPKDGRWVVLLDVGADDTALVITDGMRFWERCVPIGGGHFAAAQAKALKIDFAEADRLKRDASRAPEPGAKVPAMRRVLDDFAAEVGRSIGFFTSINLTASIAGAVGLGRRVQAAGVARPPSTASGPRGGGSPEFRAPRRGQRDRRAGPPGGRVTVRRGVRPGVAGVGQGVVADEPAATGVAGHPRLVAGRRGGTCPTPAGPELAWRTRRDPGARRPGGMATALGTAGAARDARLPRLPCRLANAGPGRVPDLWLAAVSGSGSGVLGEGRTVPPVRLRLPLGRRKVLPLPLGDG